VEVDGGAMVAVVVAIAANWNVECVWGESGRTGGGRAGDESVG
jgi:hypothetical protein